MPRGACAQPHVHLRDKTADLCAVCSCQQRHRLTRRRKTLQRAFQGPVAVERERVRAARRRFSTSHVLQVAQDVGVERGGRSGRVRHELPWLSRRRVAAMADQSATSGARAMRRWPASADARSGNSVPIVGGQNGCGSCDDASTSRPNAGVGAVDGACAQRNHRRATATWAGSPSLVAPARRQVRNPVLGPQIRHGQRRGERAGVFASALTGCASRQSMYRRGARTPHADRRPGARQKRVRISTHQPRTWGSSFASRVAHLQQAAGPLVEACWQWRRFRWLLRTISMMLAAPGP